MEQFRTLLNEGRMPPDGLRRIKELSIALDEAMDRRHFRIDELEWSGACVKKSLQDHTLAGIKRRIVRGITSGIQPALETLRSETLADDQLESAARQYWGCRNRLDELLLTLEVFCHFHRVHVSYWAKFDFVAKAFLAHADSVAQQGLSLSASTASLQSSGKEALGRVTNDLHFRLLQLRRLATS